MSHLPMIGYKIIRESAGRIRWRGAAHVQPTCSPRAAHMHVPLTVSII